MTKNSRSKSVSSCTLNNGFCSSSFLLERGARQEDPLSPYLIVIVVEIVVVAVRSDSTMKGIKNLAMTKQRSSLTMYVDDMTAILFDIQSALFERCFGLGLNRENLFFMPKKKNSGIREGCRYLVRSLSLKLF